MLKVDHGVVRHIAPNGTVIEATFKQGRIHGLYRLVCDDEVYISVEKEGKALAYVLLD